MSEVALLTGGCGFIGSHLLEHFHRKTDWKFIVIDKLTYASKGLDRLRDTGLLDSSRVTFFSWDLCNEFTDGMCKELNAVTYIIHLAADTHVDDSIANPVKVINNNIMSTVQLLEYCRKKKNLKKIIYFSTDEVYGPALNGNSFKEDDPHNPTNPYSASKSSGEMIVKSYCNTYKVPVIITNTMNVFGERQHVEKFIPKVVKNILNDNKIFVHSYPNLEKSGSRFYIHARNVADAILFIINKGSLGESYNIKGSLEVTNLQIVEIIQKHLRKEADYELVNFHEDRPGHDLRYSIDGNKLESLGWTPPVDFNHSIKKTVDWLVTNQQWLEE